MNPAQKAKLYGLSDGEYKRLSAVLHRRVEELFPRASKRYLDQVNQELAKAKVESKPGVPASVDETLWSRAKHGERHLKPQVLEVFINMYNLDFGLLYQQALELREEDLYPRSKEKSVPDSVAETITTETFVMGDYHHDDKRHSVIGDGNVVLTVSSGTAAGEIVDLLHRATNVDTSKKKR